MTADTAPAWPDPAREGAPLNPERNGIHWISRQGALIPMPWNATMGGVGFGAWETDGESDFTEEDAARLWEYHGPCLTPSEATTREAAAVAAAAGEMREAVPDPGGEYLFGLRCGVEDRSITCRYEAAEYGWQQAFEYVASVLPEPDTTALDRLLAEAREAGRREALTATTGEAAAEAFLQGFYGSETGFTQSIKAGLDAIKARSTPA